MFLPENCVDGVIQSLHVILFCIYINFIKNIDSLLITKRLLVGTYVID